MKKNNYKSFSLLIPAVFFIILFGCNKPNVYGQSNITVTGIGTVFAQPDMVQMSVSLSNVARTTRQAQIEVNKMIKQVIDILNEAGIEERNIRTTSLRFNSEYEWRGNRRILTGQKVEQIITFSVNGIKENTEKAPEILDKITQVSNIKLNQINFRISDNSALFAESRELAYQEALAKAEQYAKLSGLKIVKVLNISEPETPLKNDATYFHGIVARREVEDDSSSTILSTGELEISTKITVIFLAE
jgi:uncharacterized protein YggE